MSGWHANQVAVIDDDDDLRHALTQLLELSGWKVSGFARGEQALEVIDRHFRGVILCDVRMPGLDGQDVQRRFHAIDPDLPVILLTGHGDVPMAVSALQHGAYDFLTKPFVPEHIVSTIKRALEQRSMHLELANLRQVSRPAWPLLGETPVMQQLAKTIEQVAALDLDILIAGETGTGKGLVAKTLHDASTRARKPLVTLDCGALNEANIDRDLFGAAPGYFSGVSQRWIGRFEQADGGTLFLDCIDSLELPLQQRFERTLETRSIVPLGRTMAESVNVRVISASNVALIDQVSAGRFSAPLYYRLNSMTLRIPPLRERRDDVPILFSAFLKRACDLAGRNVPNLKPHVWRHLLQHDWPGNVRELMHYADQVALGLDAADVRTPELASKLDSAKGLKNLVAEYETRVIEDVLKQTNGNIGDALNALKLPRKTLYDKIDRLGIDLARFKRK